MQSVLITGGSGLIGRHLRKKLLEKGYKVALLSRVKRRDAEALTYIWDPENKSIEAEALEHADYIIHLAGANMGEKRWTDERKKLLLESRVKGAQFLLEQVKKNNKRPKAFISASAIGYYGMITSEKIFTEKDPPAGDLLGEICTQWEESADEFEKEGIRTVKIRTALVLSKQGGALDKMLGPINWGIGSPIGSGKQYLPWIHLDDLCNIYIKAMEDTQIRGAYNAVAPEHKTNKEVMSALAKVLGKPFWFPAVPAFVLKILFGEMSAMILTGSRISSEKIRSAGFTFRFSRLEDALKDLFGGK